MTIMGSGFIQIIIGLTMASVAGWVLLSPYLGHPVPAIEWLILAMFSVLIGLLLIGRGLPRLFESEPVERPNISKQHDQTMDWHRR